MFPDAIWLIPETDDYDSSINAFYRSVDQDSIRQKKKAALEYADRLAAMQDNAFREIVQYCKSI